MKSAPAPASSLRLLVVAILSLAGTAALCHAQETVTLRGAIVDSDTNAPLAARLYIESSEGNHFLAQSIGGNAVPYEKQRDASVEIHTSLSARPFEAELPPGAYTLTVERGKEYAPAVLSVTVVDSPLALEIPLHRWIDMSASGWFSGETHVHRTLEELPTLQLCEDLNVTLPLTAWVRQLEATPSGGNLSEEPVPPAELIRIDNTPVIWPVNTEYEITSVKNERHPLGALFVLNHRKPLDLTAPPVIPVALEARRQGALLDLDKHNWPWSLMLIPAIQVDLFELTNNHLWRTAFRFSNWHSESIPAHMQIDLADGHYTERGWIDFGFKTYYALLNCGFDMKPSAGTASGVHPVPLGFGRVYVRVDGAFDYDRWIQGLREGRSFVTTGPMLTATFNGRDPGSVLSFPEGASASVRISGAVRSLPPHHSVEVIVNGEIARTIPGANRVAESGAHGTDFDILLPLEESSWVALRVFENRKDGRPRFAHTAPVRIDIAGKPLRPKRVDVEHFLQRIEAELERNADVLPGTALREYRKAESHYRKLLEQAR